MGMGLHIHHVVNGLRERGTLVTTLWRLVSTTPRLDGGGVGIKHVKYLATGPLVADTVTNDGMAGRSRRRGPARLSYPA